VFSLLGAGLVFCLVVMFLLEAVVLRRLSALSRGVAAVGRSRDFSARLEARGGDELASLGSSINGMLFELQRTVEARQAAEELARKELLLREIHHRVKNNMQVISSLLYLQARQAGDPRLEAILEENRRRIRSMALIHEKLYQSEQTGSVRLAPYLRDLTNNLLIAYGVGAPGVRLELAVGEEMELALDTAILLGLLVGELASNSLKHAFPGGIGGVLRIALEPCGEGAFRLEVGDDGVGLPVGCDPRTSQSMGFKLVRLFAAQLEASLEVERDSGVSFRFLFKPGR
jgi:two-component sensor histidine kinase